MFTPSLMCSGKAANAIDVGMIGGEVSAPAPRTGWGQWNATPREAICSYKT